MRVQDCGFTVQGLGCWDGGHRGERRGTLLMLSLEGRHPRLAWMRERVCECVCVCERGRRECVCLSVCERERERERERDTERESVCVCVRERECVC